MKIILTAALAATALVGMASAADARDGCGRGAYRGPGGYCRPAYGPGPAVVVDVPRIGIFYEGRGYWDGHRYWAHRERWHRGWRYR